jgi:hypothetical protein
MGFVRSQPPSAIAPGTRRSETARLRCGGSQARFWSVTPPEIRSNPRPGASQTPGGINRAGSSLPVCSSFRDWPQHCLSCSTHADGTLALEIALKGPSGEVLDSID